MDLYFPPSARRPDPAALRRVRRPTRDAGVTASLIGSPVKERAELQNQRPLRIAVDGYHLGMVEGTGLAVYTLNLTRTLRRMGAEIHPLYGGQRDSSSPTPEIAFFDSFRPVRQRRRGRLERLFSLVPLFTLGLGARLGRTTEAHCIEKVTGVDLSRSRPYQKNDNRFVEQKNGTLVRRYLGDARLDTVAQTLLLNELYEKMWLFYNFFQPVMRQVEKEFILEDGQLTRVKRRFDEAKTPFKRACEAKAIPQERQEELTRLRDQTNPRRLRREIYAMLDQLFRLPCTAPGAVEDVMLTLRMPAMLSQP